MRRRFILGVVFLGAALLAVGCSSYTTGPAGTTVKSVPWPWATLRTSAISKAGEGTNEAERKPDTPGSSHRPIDSHLYR